MNLLHFSLILYCSLSIQETCGLVLGRSFRSADLKPSTTAAPIDKKDVAKKCDPCPKGIRCVPPIQCPAHVRLSIVDKPQLCDLPLHGGHGYCCTSGQNHTASNGHDSHHHHYYSSSSSGRSIENDEAHEHINIKRFRAIIEEARTAFAGDLQKEKLQTHVIPQGHPEFFHNLVFRSSHASEMRALDLSHRAMEQVYASRLYKKRERIPTEDFELGQVRENLDGTPLANSCTGNVACASFGEKFRTPDGKCNNPDHPLWGSAGTPMERLLPPSYEDGIWEPKTFSVHGTPLTNARTISREILRDVNRPHQKYNLLVMQFGQFLTHDLTHSAAIRKENGKSVSCCSEDGTSMLAHEELHYSCWPILIEPHDEFYDQFNQHCINFVRSSLAPDGRCKLGYGKQISKVTHYLDASTVYGSDLKTQNEVRSFKQGRLRMLDDFGRDLLPLTDRKSICGGENTPCFFAGDGRLNQIISLVSVQTLFAREHNRIATILSEINPQWSDERLFAESRHIVIAELQHITYNEWLPYIIGTENMHRFDLNVREHGYSFDYDYHLNPSVTAEFTTAAFRFGHSTVDGKFVVNHGKQMDEIINIDDTMFNTGRLRLRNFYDELWNTLTHQPMQEVDSAITRGLTNFLFRGHNPFGLDLAAINIQRGRDHALRGYNDYLEVSGNRRIVDFREFGPEAAEKLSSVYKHPDDIDLWIGGLIEAARADSLVGHTFAEIIADQFSRLRRGDRYFHEHSPESNPGAFSPDQLQQIRLSSMARLICDNADGRALRSVGPQGFVQADFPGNTPVSCDDLSIIPSLNFMAWKE